MSFWLTIALQAAQAPPETIVFDLANVTQTRSPAKSSIIVQRCSGITTDDEIVVCGTKRQSYRMPLPNERELTHDRPRGEALTGTDVLRPAGRCGIFEGEKRCNKQEATDYGYGSGRDPITVLSRVVQKMVDADAN